MMKNKEEVSKQMKEAINELHKLSSQPSSHEREKLIRLWSRVKNDAIAKLSESNSPYSSK